MIAPVGHTSRQPARTQCLHTSLIISHRLPCRKPFISRLTGSCSMKRTCRQSSAFRCPVLSYELPVSSVAPLFCAGSSFHSWHATWHALQPMQTVVSVKNPLAMHASSVLASDQRSAISDQNCSRNLIADR